MALVRGALVMSSGRGKRAQWAPRRATSAIILGAFVLLTGCAEERLSGNCAPRDDVLSSGAVVTRAHGEFRLDAEPYVPEGVNAYWVLGAARRGQMDRVEALFDTLVERRVTLVRIWAFDQRQRSAIHRRDGTFDEDALVALDHIFAAASNRGLRLVATLSNQWADFGGLAVYAGWAGVEMGPDALASPAVRASLAAYGRHLAARTNTVTGVAYRDDPTLFGWDLVNELRCEGCAPGLASAFLADVAARLREVDDRHLIGAGDEGFSAEHGVDVRRHSATGELDWVSAHVWPQHWRTLPNVNGDLDGAGLRAATEGRRWIRTRSAIAREYDLPLLVGELGWHRELGGKRRRAVVLTSWVEEARKHRAGSLVWVFGDDEFEDYDGYTVREDDDAARVFCR